MSTKWRCAVVFLCAALFLASSRALSDDKKGQPPGGMDADQMKAMMEGMQKWMDSMKPGKQHQALEHFVGTWETTMKIWMGGPGTPPSETKGITTVKWVLGKRFLMEEHKGQMPLPDMTGQMQLQPYEGIGMTGYDKHRNMYQSSWTSNMQTNMLTMTGSADPSGKVFRYYGEMDEAMLNVIGRTVKYVTTIQDENTHVFEIFDLHAGDNYKVIEITYKRKK